MNNIFLMQNKIVLHNKIFLKASKMIMGTPDSDHFVPWDGRWSNFYIVINTNHFHFTDEETGSGQSNLDWPY